MEAKSPKALRCQTYLKKCNLHIFSAEIFTVVGKLSIITYPTQSFSPNSKTRLNLNRYFRKIKPEISSFRNVLWMKKLHLAFLWHGSREILTELSFLGKLFFKRFTLFEEVLERRANLGMCCSSRGPLQRIILEPRRDSTWNTWRCMFILNWPHTKLN